MLEGKTQPKGCLANRVQIRRRGCKGGSWGSTLRHIWWHDGCFLIIVPSPRDTVGRACTVEQSTNLRKRFTWVDVACRVEGVINLAGAAQSTNLYAPASSAPALPALSALPALALHALPVFPALPAPGFPRCLCPRCQHQPRCPALPASASPALPAYVLPTPASISRVDARELTVTTLPVLVASVTGKAQTAKPRGCTGWLPRLLGFACQGGVEGTEKESCNKE